MDIKAKEIWQSMLPLLEKEVSILTYDVWIKTLEAVQIKDSKLILLAPGEQGREFVLSRYYELIKRAMQLVNTLLVDVEVISKEEMKNFSTEDTFVVTEEPITTALPVSINPKYNFENFVVGKSNKLAYAAAHAVAEEPGCRYNPLFIYGGAGLGKTHLMHSIGNYLKMTAPATKILFVTSEKFVNDLVSCIGFSNKGNSFREKYRNADCLMVDDIQFIAGKTATTEEIFHTFNELYNAGKQLIFTSDRVPKDIPDIDDRLRSRFEWGFTADVQSPDLETRIAILRKKAQLQKYNISMDVLQYMAECIDSNVREMEGLLNKVLMLSQLEDEQPGIKHVKEAMKEYTAKEGDSVEADDIISATCKIFGVKREDLLGKKKTRDIVEPRQICVYCITELLEMPLSSIGNIFGGRDHSTILYSRNSVAEKLQTNAKTRMDVENIKSMVYKK